MDDDIKIQSVFNETEIDALKKRMLDMELQISALNPRNLAGISSTDLREATRANLFGDGSDGDVEIASGTTTLSRDMFYKNLTIRNGATIAPTGYKIYCQEDFINNGTCSRNGNNGGNASGTTQGSAGAVLSAGTLPGSPVGGEGGDGSSIAPGCNGKDSANISPAVGTAGSNGGSTGYTAGVGGTVTNAREIPRSYISAISLLDKFPSIAAILGSASSGGGAGGIGTLNNGGGGGGASGGGVLMIIANRIINNGTITANGGNGGNGGNAADGGGGNGGGGGPGGVIIRIYGTLSGTGSWNASGGNGGAIGTGTGGYGNGVVGQGGSAGKIYDIQIK